MDVEPSNQCLGPLESQGQRGCFHREPPVDDPNTALNASFDSSMLRKSRGEASFPINHHRLRAAASWDEREGVTESAGLEQATHLNMPELPPSTTSAERSLRLGSDFVAAAGTPVRLRFKPPGTARKGKLTPASAKRRRAPVHLHPHHQHPSRARSPLHRGGVCKPTRVSATSSALTNRSLAVETPCPLPGPVPQLQPMRQKQQFVSSSALETTTETFESSADASLESSTPFRFTSFPASLPRIHNLPMRPQPTANNGEGSGANPDCISCPPTVRKRMSFGDSLAAHRSSYPADSQDSSFSSLLLDCGDDQREHLSHLDVPRPQPPQAEDLSCLDATTEAQFMGTPVPRARLNFSSTASPNSMHEAGVLRGMVKSSTVVAPQVLILTHISLLTDELGMQVDGDELKPNGPYEAHAASSFASSVSSLKNEDGIFPYPHSTGTPARAPAAVFLPSSSSRPQTPREMNLHFQLDAAQCSPIPGIPEEDGDLSSSKSSCPASSSKRRQNTSSFRLSTSRDSESTDRSGGQRSSRPMPDMTAFEGDGSTSSRDRSFDDSSKSAGSKHPSSPRLMCPPTPVRTPAWAHSEAAGVPIFKTGGLKRYSRSNSLIATKVLATCSPHVLDGRASLESSLGESQESHEDRSKSGDFSDDDTVADDAADRGNGSWQHNGRSDGPPAADGATPSARRESLHGVGEEVSMGTHFDVLSTLGRGTFADVFRVRSRIDGRLYAVKRNRRQFRGTRDREKALAEVKCMQRLQSFGEKHEGRAPSSYSLYILFFYQAWQEDGYFFCQTELCCRDTCRDVHESLRANWSVSRTRYKSLSRLPVPPRDGLHPTVDGRLFPEISLWKIVHDVAAGLSHIHSHGLVHFDIKPSNLFLVPHVRFGAITKIGDFGMAGEIGSSEDGQEGDQIYMAGELLSSDRKHPSADIFSLGLALFELASNLSFVLPSEGPRWHQLRMGRQPTSSDIPSCRSADLVSLIHSMISLRDERPTAESILQIQSVQSAGLSCDEFLRDYLFDIEEFDRREEQTSGFAFPEDQTPRHAHTTGRSLVCSPTTYFLPKPPLLSSPEAAHS